MESSAKLHIQLLGSFRVHLNGQDLNAERWPRRLANLLKLVALSPNGRLHRDEVLETLWPELPAKAAMNNLHGTLHALRQLLPNLPPSYLRIKEHYLVLGPPEGVSVDVKIFIAQAERARHSQQVDDYEAARAYYRGDLLPEDQYQDWAANRREELKSLYLDLLIELASLHEKNGNHTATLDTLRKALEQEPALETAHRNVMRLHLQMNQPQMALKQYARLHKVLQDEFDAEPDEESRAFYETILTRTGSRHEEPKANSRPADLPPTNLLPSLSSFVGRETELMHLMPLLGTTRLLTLRGAPGCGKSRLTLEFALRSRHAFRDGIWRVDLSEEIDPTHLPEKVAQKLDLQEVTLFEELSQHIRDKDILLILDNAEHLSLACAHFTEALLDRCSKLRVIVTSCIPLGVSHEVIWRVPPLCLPPEGADLEEIQNSEAVQLFLERARLYRPAFRFTPELAPIIQDIVGQLDGLPLAIQLLVPKLSALSVEQISARLGNLLRLLRSDSPTIPPRHRSYEVALDRIHTLLSQEEQDFFISLASFAEPFSLEDLEDLYGTEFDIPARLTTLVSSSLLTVQGPGNQLRYRLLEPIRQYALKRFGEEQSGRDVQGNARG